MRLPGIGGVFFWPGGSLWIGTTTVVSERHAHHAIQLAIGISGPVQFRADADAHWQTYDAALIPSRFFHSFQAPGVRLANILFDPQSVAGRSAAKLVSAGRIRRMQAAETRLWADRLGRAFSDGAGDEEMQSLAQRAVADICCTEAPDRPTDPRILRAIDFIYGRLDEPLTLGQVADMVHLSEGRLRHLFVHETGTGFRPFVLWARLNRAVELGFSSGNWTDAAHSAGFADSAHLSRTCRSMFGFAPSSMRQRNGSRPAEVSG